MNETELMQRIRAVFCKAGTTVRVFRNNVGVFFRLPQGAKCAKCKISHKDGENISGGSRVACGLGVGSADLVGIQQIVVTQDMVGKKIGQFFAREIKTATGRASQEQKAWLETIRRFGGDAEICRSEEEAERHLRRTVNVSEGEDEGAGDEILREGDS